MILIVIMICFGCVKGNCMVDMQLFNDKFVDCGIKMVMEVIGLEYEVVNEFLLKYGNVWVVVVVFFC